MGDHPSLQDRPGAHALRVRLYGDPAVVLPDGRGVALERRAAALLALAALEPGISRRRVATLLWPDSSDPRRNLRQQLLRFRRLFGHALVEGDATLTVAGFRLDEPGDAVPAAAQLLGGLAYEDCAQFDAWLHYLNQDTACAHAAFENLERMLATEFGARPSAETLALMRRRGGRGQPVG